jgi:hypothetical protein
MERNMKTLEQAFREIIIANTNPEAWTWIQERSSGSASDFNLAFAAIPRKTGKNRIKLTAQQEKVLSDVGDNNVKNWTIDRLARVWLLMRYDSSDRERYKQNIEQLFKSAEMNELVALYSSLPFLPYPEEWRMRCAEGIRSNIGLVLESIMYDNPYPAKYLPEPAWNQLVLKAIFTDKDISKIIGIDERANQDLANILSDYAHERWAAGRPVNPQLWRCVGKFINENLLNDVRKLSFSENRFEREAAALALADSNYRPAKELLENDPKLRSMISSGEVSWKTLADHIQMKTN